MGPFKYSEQKFRIIVGFILLFISLAVLFLGRDAYFGYNDRYYLLELVVLFPLALYGSGLLARLVFDMYEWPPKL